MEEFVTPKTENVIKQNLISRNIVQNDHRLKSEGNCQLSASRGRCSASMMGACSTPQSEL